MGATHRGQGIADYRSKMDEIHGSLHRDDSYVLEIIDGLQKQSDITGDILEIGTYQGKSAILLGYLPGPTERLHVCDRFVPPSTDDPDFLPDTLDYYRDYPQSVFERQYLRFHNELPEMHVGSSVDLHDRLEAGSFRFIHLDGSHRRDVLRSDIDLAKKLLVDGGVMSLCAYRIPATLEVSAAAWGEVAEGALTPICATGWELYLTTSSPPASFMNELIERIRAVPSLKMSTPPFGDSVVPLVSEDRDSRIDPRKYVPPVLVPTMINLKRRLGRLSQNSRSRA